MDSASLPPSRQGVLIRSSVDVQFPEFRFLGHEEPWLGESHCGHLSTRCHPISALEGVLGAGESRYPIGLFGSWDIGAPHSMSGSTVLARNPVLHRATTCHVPRH